MPEIFIQVIALEDDTVHSESRQDALYRGIHTSIMPASRIPAVVV